MSDDPTSNVRLLAPAQVGEVLGVSVDEVMALVLDVLPTLGADVDRQSALRPQESPTQGGVRS